MADGLQFFVFFHNHLGFSQLHTGIKSDMFVVQNPSSNSTYGTPNEYVEKSGTDQLTRIAHQFDVGFSQKYGECRNENHGNGVIPDNKKFNDDLK